MQSTTSRDPLHHRIEQIFIDLQDDLPEARRRAKALMTEDFHRRVAQGDLALVGGLGYERHGKNVESELSKAKKNLKERHGLDVVDLFVPAIVRRHVDANEEGYKRAMQSRRGAIVMGKPVLAMALSTLETFQPTSAKGWHRVGAAIAFLTGRRSCEIVEEGTTFKPVEGEPFQAIVKGLRQKKGDKALAKHRIPLLAPFSLIDTRLSLYRDFLQGQKAKGTTGTYWSGDLNKAGKELFAGLITFCKDQGTSGYHTATRGAYAKMAFDRRAENRFYPEMGSFSEWSRNAFGHESFQANYDVVTVV